jgi:hypothetical protein
MAAAPPKPVRARRRRGTSAGAMVLQVVLIAVGVFLGLAGEQWREDRENERLAADTLRRFRTEIRTNREMILENMDYHAKTHAELEAYLATPEGQRGTVPFDGIRVPRFESNAWDLALATGSLAYLDAELAFSLSRTYALQTITNQLGASLAQRMYAQPPKVEREAFVGVLELYYDDLTDIEPLLVPAYDTLIVAIDEALAE